MSRPRIRAGQLSSRVVIESSTTADNEFGEAVPTWSTLATVWAQVETMKGDEKMASGAERTESPVVFTMRHRSDVTTDTTRLSHDSAIYDIESVENVLGKNKLLRVTGVARG